MPQFFRIFLECLIFLKIVRKNQIFLKILIKKLKILYFPKNALGSPFYAIFMPKFFRIFWECLIFLKIVWKKSNFFDILLNKSQIYQIPHIWVKYRTTAQRKFSTHTGVQIPHKLAVSRTFWQLCLQKVKLSILKSRRLAALGGVCGWVTLFTTPTRPSTEFPPTF